MCLSSPSAPAPQAPPAPLQNVQIASDAAVSQQQRQAALMAGMNQTIKTSGLGVPGNPTTAVKSLLGQ
jgi:hypothetical protein